MAQNLKQVFDANPAASILATDILYLIRSPFGLTNDMGITFDNLAHSLLPTVSTANAIPKFSDTDGYPLLNSSVLIDGSNNVTGMASLYIGASSKNASAIMQMDSTTQGFLPPRMTTAQRDLIATPATGLTIFNTTTGQTEEYNGSAWSASGGDVNGPASATDNALVRWDSTTGKLVKNSGALLDNSNNLSGIAQLSLTNIVTPAATDLNINATTGFVRFNSNNITGIATAIGTSLDFTTLINTNTVGLTAMTVGAAVGNVRLSPGVGANIDALSNPIVNVTTLGVGTVNATTEINSPRFNAERVDGTTITLAMKHTGDANNRFQMNADGLMEWGNGTATYDTLLQRTAASTLKLSDAAGTGAGTLNTVGGTVQANTFSNASGNISITPAGGVLALTGSLTTTVAITTTIASGNDFYAAKFSGDSANRFYFFKGTNQSAMLLGDGTGNGTYLNYLGSNGTFKITSASNGTGNGNLDLGTGTLTAATMTRGSSSFTLDGANVALGSSTGITFPTTGGTAAALTYYETYTNTVSLSGIWAASQTATINITRIGNSVTMWLGGGILTTANTAAVISAAASSIPTRFVGSNEAIWSSFMRQTFNIRDNGTDKTGSIQINANGSFSIGAGAGTTTAFAGAGSSGFPGQGISWSL